jgi:hypothetical protein
VGLKRRRCLEDHERGVAFGLLVFVFKVRGFEAIYLRDEESIEVLSKILESAGFQSLAE